MKQTYCVLVIVALASVATAETPADRFEPDEHYTPLAIEGWQVLVHQSLLNEKAELGKRVIALVRLQLHQIDHRLPADAVEKLRKVKIWVELNEPHHPCMVYHPDADWLIEHDMNPAKARCVEVANAERFLSWTIQQPWMVLHELAHAYHDQFVPDGFKNSQVKTVYEQAVAGKAYESVLSISGKKVRHYALTDPMEYFAEATEAYFGTNDFFPFVRSEFAEHDRAGYEVLGQLWGDGSRPTAREAVR